MSIETVAKNIRDVRRRMDLSQKEFGDLIGKSDSQVGAYENGKTDIPISVIFDIAIKTKTDVGFLMTGQAEEKQEREYDASLRIYNMDDRLEVIKILAKNGYDVGQHKKSRTPNGKTLDYYVHAVDLTTNADTSK